MERDFESHVGRKVMTFLIVPIGLYLLVGAIDRTNVSFAALQMMGDLNLTETEYGMGASILFFGYLLAKYPSVVLLEKIGLRFWLCLLCMVWGITATGMGFVQDKASFYMMRIFLGLAEAGLAAGLFLYLSNFASPRFMASVLSLPIAAIPMAQVIGSPLSGWLMDMTNPFDLAGWRWMFIIEGLPALFLGVFALFYFSNRPKTTWWLKPHEAEWLEQNAQGAHSEAAKTGKKLTALLNPITYLCAIIWLCLLAGNYGVMFWLPKVLDGFSDLTATQIGFINAMPWLGAVFGVIINAWHSDKTQERYFHIGIPCLIAAVSFVIAYFIGSGVVALIFMVVGGAFLGSTVAPFWAIPKKLLKPSELQIGVVGIHMAGGMAGLTIGGTIGWLLDTFNSFGPPIYFIAGTQILALVLCLAARALDKTHQAPGASIPAAS